jgi:hypothetical protein
MASRKPKNVNRPTGIADDIFDGIRDIVSPWLGTPPNPALSEKLNNKIAQVGQLTRGAAETLDQVYAGGLVKAGVQGNKALAQQAAVNAAALGTGYIVGKAAVTAAGAVTKTGLPQRLKNTLLNQSVVVHGTGRPIVGNQIRPTAGSPGSPNKAVVFAWNPKYNPPDQKWIASSAGEYAGKPYYKGGVEVPGQGNVVIGTVKNKNLVRGEFGEYKTSSPIVASTGPMKIKEIVKYDADTQRYVKNLERALQRQGIRVKPNALEIRASKKEAAELAKRLRISNKKSIF